jgi:hypothetical protein
VASEVEKLSVQDKPPQESMIPKNSNDKLQAAKPSSARPTEEAAADQSAFPGKKNSTSWKRLSRAKEDDKLKQVEVLKTQGPTLGAPRKRQEDEEDDLNIHEPLKKRMFQVPSLEACLGKEELRQLREQENYNKGESCDIQKQGVGSSDSNSFEVTVDNDTDAADELVDRTQQAANNQNNGGTSSQSAREDGTDPSKEAADHGATGNLTGTKERVCQEQ